MTLSVLAAALALVVTACAPVRAERVDVQEAGQDVTLESGASVRVRGTDLTVSFESLVEDSRCPKGVNCVWEGDASVRIAVSQEGKDPVRYTLHTNDRFEREAVHGATRIRLLTVEPYPQAGKFAKREDYRVTLSIGSK